MAYASASDVAARTYNLVSGASSFSASTTPNETQVNLWLSSGCAIINSVLATNGYSVPAGSGTTVYDWLLDLNALYAAAQSEVARTNITLAPGERTRGQVMEKKFWDDLDRLSHIDLSQLGLSRNAVGAIYIGGTSIAEKQIYETDTDRVPPRFSRGQSRFPGTLDPTSTTAS